MFRVETEKKCKSCEQVKPVSLFYTDSKDECKYRADCRECLSVYGHKKYMEKRETYLVQHRRYYNTNKDKFKKYNREGRLIRIFGITSEQYDAMLKKQGGVCLLCGDVNRDGRHLAVDHDPKSGAIRGLLCGDCNMCLGKMHDSPEMLRKAALYIENKGDI